MNLELVELIVLGLLAAAIALAVIRLWIGPGTADRIVAADILSVIATVVIVFLSLTFKSALYLDIALIYSVLAFAGIIALARAIEGNGS